MWKSRLHLPCRGCQGANAAVNEVCAAARAPHTPPARSPAPGTPGSSCPPSSPLPGPFLPLGPPPERPRLPDPSRGTFSAGPRRSVPLSPAPLPPERPAVVRGRSGTGRRRGSLRLLWEPLRPSPTFPEAETAAAGAAHRVPGQRDSPRP